MARPVKDGLGYFPKDTGFYADRKIRMLMARFGSDGAVLYDYILCEVYREHGYYLCVDDDFVDVAAADLHISAEKIGLILDYLLRKSLLTEIRREDADTVDTLRIGVKVLTSHGIQKRFQAAVKDRRRDTVVREDLWLLDAAETESSIKVQANENKSPKNPSYSGKNPGLYTEKPLKERKGKESKEKHVCPEREHPASGPAAILLPLNTGQDFAVTDDQIKEWQSLYPAVDVMQELRKMRGWLQSNPQRRKTARGVLRFAYGWLAKEQDKGRVLTGASTKQTGAAWRAFDEQ